MFRSSSRARSKPPRVVSIRPARPSSSGPSRRYAASAARSASNRSSADPAAPERRLGVVEGGPVVDRDQDVAQGARRDASREQVADPVDVAGRLGHLRARHLEVGAVQPGLDERQAGCGLALGELVLVVGEDQVDRPGVDVERRAEVLHAHRRALDVPARPALADRRRVGRLAGLGALPQGEVADVVLGVLVGLDPLPDPELVGIEPGQPAVRRPRRDPEEDRAVVGPVGVSAVEQAADQAGRSPGCGRSPGAGRPAGSSAGPPRRSRSDRSSGSASSPIEMPWAAAPRMILSSMSVMFMTQVTRSPR